MTNGLDIELLRELIDLGELAASYGGRAAPQLMLTDLRAATPTVVGSKLCRIADNIRLTDLAVTVESPTILAFPPQQSWWEWSVGIVEGAVHSDLAPYDRVGMLVLADKTGRYGTLQPVTRNPADALNRLEIWSLALAFDLRRTAGPVQSLLPMARAREILGRMMRSETSTPAEADALPKVTERFGRHFGVVPSPYYEREIWTPETSRLKAMTIHQMPKEILLLLCMLIGQKLVETTTTAVEHYHVLEAA